MIQHKLGLLMVVQVIGMCVVTYSDNVFCTFEVISRLDYEIDQYLRSRKYFNFAWYRTPGHENANIRFS